MQSSNGIDDENGDCEHGGYCTRRKFIIVDPPRVHRALTSRQKLRISQINRHADEEMKGREMETEKIEGYQASPWHPIENPVDLKHLGKLCEEANELGGIIARCIIQGVDESDPTTGKVNRVALQEEIADVIANCQLVSDRFKLDDEAISERIQKKMKLLKSWHDMA